VAKPRLAQAARDDVADIRGYSKAVFGTPVALEYLNGLRATLHRIADRPLAGIAEEDLGEGMRSYPYRSHRIYYRCDAARVLIVRILHHAQDARAMLSRQ
jgi:toxin ParE1/3/4